MERISKQEINTATSWCRADLVIDQSRLERFTAVEIATFDLAVFL
jgi:hypothetical protein